MSHRAVRITLLVIALLAQALVGYKVWDIQTQANADRAAAREFDRLATAEIVAAAELRAAQEAYVAAGQGEPFWMGKVASLWQAANERIATVRARARTPEGSAALEAATELFTDFEQMDKRAREYVRAGQRLSASDLIFGDGVEITTKIAGRLEDARARESGAVETTLAAHRRLQAILLASGAGATMIVLALLVPGSRVPQTPGVPGVFDVASTGAAGRATDLGHLAAPSGASLGDLILDPVALSPGGGSSPRIVPDLGAAAQLCADLARVEETGELAGLLARAASVLDASGIIIWMPEGARAGLRPVLAHGYSAQTLGKMGTLARDAENATAAAFRAGQLRTVAGDAFSSGAIVVPLVTSAGCIGVMAAEVRNGAETEPNERALATILAAQLSTLITPAPTESAVQAQG